MEINNSGISTLGALLNYDSKKHINAEIQLKTVLPEWINKAGSVKLKTVLEKYLELVQQHIQKIENFIEEEPATSFKVINRVMEAYIKEAEQKLFDCIDQDVRDAALLASIQAINHFKISAYGTAASLAKVLNSEKQAELFYSIEINEKQIDDRLSQLAEHEVNIKAKEPNIYLK